MSHLNKCLLPCQKAFRTQQALSAHRSNTLECLRRYNFYLENLLSQFGNHALNPEHEQPLPNGNVMMDADESLDMDVNWDDAAIMSPSSVDGESIGSDAEPRAAEWTGVQIGMAEPVEDGDNTYEEIYPGSGEVVKKASSAFHLQRASQETLYDGNVHYPFSSAREWKLAQWLHQSGASLAKIDEFLKLSYVLARPLSFRTGAALFDRIAQLPDPGTRWMAKLMEPSSGHSAEPIMLFYRNPLDVVKMLFTLPSLAEHMVFQPRNIWEDESMEHRVYNEMCTGNYWNRVQDTLPEGATLVPILLGSDATHLTNFAGDKKAWPVYMSLGNIHSKIRNNPSKKAWRLIAYIPVVNWLDVDTIRTTLQNRLYHECMEFVLQSLINPGLHGVDICDSKGDTRHSYLRIAAHLADLPEQSLIACATRLSSPVTTAGWEDLDNPQPSPPRTREWILSRIEAVSREVPPGDVLRYQKAAKSRGLNGVHRPFWRDLPGYQPEFCLAPDLLHGVIRFWRDHILKWALKLVGPAEFDRRLMALQPVVGFQQFKSGIQHLSQWTMSVDRELLRTFVVITAHCPSITPTLMQNFRAFSDFLMLVQYRSHSDETLEYLDDALKAFHRTLPEYIRTGARSGKKGVINHFRIPKLSLFHTYKAHIIEMGTSPQFSTEIIESNHRSMAKDAYNATNHKDHMKQMCRVLDRGERIDYREEFLQWYAEQCEIEELEKQYDMYTPVYRKFVVKRTLEERQNTKDEEKSIRFASKHARIWVTERPSRVRLQVIAIAEEYGLPDLPDRIGRHLRRTGHTLSFRDVDYLDIWTRLRIRAESAQGDGADPPHTVEALPPSDDLPWGRCHCVLVHEGDEVYNVGLNGYRVAQVRLIFRVRFLDRSTPPLQLVYVQWFSRLPDNTEKDICMFQVSRQDRGGHREGDVISMASIARFIQLVPKFGPEAKQGLSAKNSMDTVRDYYVNSFADKEIYQSVY